MAMTDAVKVERNLRDVITLVERNLVQVYADLSLPYPEIKAPCYNREDTQSLFEEELWVDTLRLDIVQDNLRILGNCILRLRTSIGLEQKPPEDEVKAKLAKEMANSVRRL
jgi:hypothetical protein